jgi:hypothetical protein
MRFSAASYAFSASSTCCKQQATQGEKQVTERKKERGRETEKERENQRETEREASRTNLGSALEDRVDGSLLDGLERVLVGLLDGTLRRVRLCKQE